MLEHTEELFDRWQQVTAGTWSRCKFRKLMVPVQRRVKELLDKGERVWARENQRNVSAETDGGNGTVGTVDF